MPDLTVEQVDRLMLALDNLDAYLEGLDTARKPRTKVVYRDPPDPKAVDLSQLADSIHRRLTLLEADAAQGAAPRAKEHDEECGNPNADEPGCPCYCHFRTPEGAAPRAEGPTERLTKFLVTITDDDGFDWSYHGSRREMAREIINFLARRPSDERVPESVESSDDR
jgi:hypothetical protein